LYPKTIESVFSIIIRNHGYQEISDELKLENVKMWNSCFIALKEVDNGARNCQLSSIAKGAKEMLGVERLDAVSDKGFFNFMEIKECVDNGITPYVPEQSRYGAGLVKKTGIPTREFSFYRFVYDKGTDTFVCPSGKRLEFAYLDHAHKKRMRVYRGLTCLTVRR
jgi:transposase